MVSLYNIHPVALAKNWWLFHRQKNLEIFFDILRQKIVWFINDIDGVVTTITQLTPQHSLNLTQLSWV